MKSKKEIIEETVAYIQANGRAVRSSAVTQAEMCAYFTTSGKMCAVGRCLIDPESARQGTVGCFPNFESALKPEYRGHTINFWSDLQRLHDEKDNWHTMNGEIKLTKMGRRAVQHMLEEFEDEE